MKRFMCLLLAVTSAGPTRTGAGREKGRIAPAPLRSRCDPSVVVATFAPIVAAVAAAILAEVPTVIAALHAEIALVAAAILTKILPVVATFVAKLARSHPALAKIAAITAAILTKVLMVVTSLASELASVAASILAEIASVVALFVSVAALVIGERRGGGDGEPHQGRRDQENTHNTVSTSVERTGGEPEWHREVALTLSNEAGRMRWATDVPARLCRRRAPGSLPLTW